MNVRQRKCIRLQGYDYTKNGAYFITICSYNREYLFGDIPVGQGLCSCRLFEIGKIIEDEILQLMVRFENVNIDKFVIMPNHVHLLIQLTCERQEQSPCPTIGDVICVLKSITTKKSNVIKVNSNNKIWQFRFYDHIIRNENEYIKIWQYIDTNPQSWEYDCFNPQNNKGAFQI